MKRFMLKRQKSMANKGFSLVELIIVIAIMAVLIAVLAPQFIKYVESSRASKDESAADEVLRAAQTAIIVEDVYNELVPGSTVTIEYPDNAAPVYTTSAATGSTTELQTEIESIVPASIDFVSKAHSDGGDDVYRVTIVVPAAGAGGAISVDGDWFEDLL